MDSAISAQRVSKRFVLAGQPRQKYHTLRDTLAHSAASWFRGARDTSGQTHEFWALRDVNFEIRSGERIGLIGRNGAGKSTLLKVLGHITEPTTGTIRIRGRMASLLEVGTGFHPELTGRENIWLSGAVYGLSRQDIARRFDDIVAFAEIEEFLETQVKRYSSGMYVRLAFAVAAHLDPDILVVDEVLAVGDLQFQKKCLAKMEDVTGEGRTLILVSHNMSTILSMSTRCFLLERGRLVLQGTPSDVVRQYQSNVQDGSFGRTDLAAVERYGGGQARFEFIDLYPVDADGQRIEFPASGCDLVVALSLRARESLAGANVAVTIYDELGNRLIDAHALMKGQSVTLAAGQAWQVTFRLRNVRLKPDLYTIGLWLGVANVGDFDGVRYATCFRIEARREDILYSAPFPGMYMCEFDYLPGEQASAR